MPEVDLIDPFRWLIDIERRAKANMDLTTKCKTKIVSDAGIGFRLNQNHFVIQLQGVLEVLPVSAFAKLPGVKPWVLGVTNLRGNLITVVSLTILCGLTIEPISSRTRMLILEIEGVKWGFVVDQVFGLQNMQEQMEFPQHSQLPNQCKNHITGILNNNDKSWYVMDIGQLLKETKFNKLILEKLN